MLEALPQDKAAARKIAALARTVAHGLNASTAPLKLAGHRFPAEPTAGFKTVSAFYPYRSEIDTRSLLGRLAGEGWTTCLPVVISAHAPLIFRRWQPGAPTVKGVMNIDVPPIENESVVPDVLIVPLLAFDRQGYRLGYGGGYYDRTLASLRASRKIVAIGAAYAAQEADTVPHESHDQPLDFVLTESEVITCG